MAAATAHAFGVWRQVDARARCLIDFEVESSPQSFNLSRSGATRTSVSACRSPLASRLPVATREHLSFPAAPKPAGGHKPRVAPTPARAHEPAPRPRYGPSVLCGNSGRRLCSRRPPGNDPPGCSLRSGYRRTPPDLILRSRCCTSLTLPPDRPTGRATTG